MSCLLKLLMKTEASTGMEALLDLAKDIWDFLRIRKKYWLAPLIVTIVLMGALIVLTHGSVVAPFIYSIF